ncbi:hypothetical protein [Hyphomicrobium sp.]|jgi:hypothetical protein|uniref:hypothetical protein n=1 Tax=Hyphomicrobium sp. TaxID=82 RepID=UPI002BC1B25A|nr:hypothetical protein [Hyphomicrobium sp.]HVZ04131.1 hypothetical protein [Hyphomicrobium sp.]
MRSIIAILSFALILFLPGSVFAKRIKERPVKPFANSAELLKWINDYRHHPEPQRVPDAVKAVSAFGLMKDPDQSGIYIGFTAGAIGANPDIAEKLVTKMFPLRPEDQVIIIKGIAYSGLPKWRLLMKKFVERMPARKDLIEKFLYGDKPILTALSIEKDPTVIDLNWGYYFATGWEAPIRRIVASLALSLDKDKVDTLTTGAMAKWTLAQNASRDNDLLMMLKKISNDSDPKIRKPLAEVIDASETLELSQLRKDALASIEELKAKGSEKLRNYNWWGQAGQTVLALGCVAAGALGQVEFGIPCVVGGAASTAALNYFKPTQ